ncbi:HotDog domain-containing protein [Mrakia frigida]|uniref:acyl-CoA thioesterase n=1 Tax=Mrakia frigida TaxID=29902 RepID=UPI003FCC14CB
MSSIEELLKSFADKHSPFYLPPGTRGPADENEITPNYTQPRPSTPTDQPPAPAPRGPIDYTKPLESWSSVQHNDWSEERQRILERAKGQGWDVEGGGAVEWPIAWGETDQFRHVNNVNFLSYFETARLSFLQALSPPLPASLVSDILSGQNIGFVVKSHFVTYKFPVTHPDSLILLSRPHSVSPESAPSSFKLAHEAWSLKTGRLVSTCETENIIYDHNAGRKAAFPEILKAALEAKQE